MTKDFQHICGETIRPRARWWALLLGVALCAAAYRPAAAQDRLIDREPFDRVVLDRANDSRELDILPDSFPERQVPDPFPRSGTLRVRLVDRPLDEFEIRWANIVEIHLFEELVLEEARQFARDGRFGDAHEYLAYLKRYHGDLPGLDRAIESVLEIEVAAAFRQADYERAWMVLTALYDRDPEHAGIVRALDSVSDRLLEAQVASGDFHRARRFLDLLRTRFGDAGSGVAARWSGKLRNIAEERTAAAHEHFAEGRLDEAREAVRAALAVQPDFAEARTLADRIAAVRPRVVVGVLAEAPRRITRRLDDWPSRRIEPLVDPPLVELSGFGADGGEYRSAYGELLRDATGLATSVSFASSSTAAQGARTPHAVARRILMLGQGEPVGLGEALVSHLAEVEVQRAETLRLSWRHAHVRPEALLRIGLSADGSLAAADPQEGERAAVALGPFHLKARSSDEVVFARGNSSPPTSPAGTAPIEIVERLFRSEDAAIDALVRGEVDVVERVGAGRVERLSGRDHVAVARYALPTVHVLVASPTSSLMELTELRRAIVYAIDRTAIARQLFAGGASLPGAVAISGPVPPGNEFADPIGYAYDRSIAPRPFDPRLAGTLASVAARLHEASGESHEKRELSESGLPELVLAHPAEPLARAACQVIAEGLQAVGVAVRLVECDSASVEHGGCEFDLRYAELAVWEPVVDVPRLLGPRGELGFCSARMGLALAEVEQARSWQGVREALHEVHRVGYDELQVIPLWQTTNYFAYRKDVTGLGPQPVSLYQDVASWELRRGESGGGGSR